MLGPDSHWWKIIIKDIDYFIFTCVEQVGDNDDDDDDDDDDCCFTTTFVHLVG